MIIKEMFHIPMKLKSELFNEKGSKGKKVLLQDM